MTRVTRQTGQVQTPSVSPDGSELVYLSDNGGHANLWVIRRTVPRARQITFERDPAVDHRRAQVVSGGRCDCLHREPRSAAAMGDPSGRPRGAQTRRAGDVGKLVATTAGGCTTPRTSNAEQVLHRERSRSQVAAGSSFRGDGQFERADGWSRTCCTSRPLVTPEFGSLGLGDPAGGSGGWAVGASRADRRRSLAVLVAVCHPALSKDGRWLAQGLADGATTNLWTLSTEDGSWRQVTDFGEPTIIVASGVVVARRTVSVRRRLQEQRRHCRCFDGLV